MSPPAWRVVLIINSLQRGGAETQLVRLARRLVADGHHVHVVTILPEDELAGELAALDVRVERLRLSRYGRGASALLSAAGVIRRERPDLIVSFLYQSNVVARVVGRLASRAVVVSSIRNEQFGGRHRELAMRLTDRLAHMTTTNSVTAGRSLVARGVVKQDRLVIVPNGLPVGLFDRPPGERAAVRSALGVRPEEFLWLAIGRLVPQKAWPTLLAAVARADEARRTGRWLIAGAGPLHDEVEAEIRRAGLLDRVRLIGPRRDIPALLGAADALVHASDYEGLPNVVLEAMAARLPVVATAVGGTAELVQDGTTGLLVPPGSPDELARALDGLAGLAPAQRRAMGESGRTVVERDYDEGAVMGRWASILGDRMAARQRIRR